MIDTQETIQYLCWNGKIVATEEERDSQNEKIINSNKKYIADFLKRKQRHELMKKHYPKYSEIFRQALVNSSYIKNVKSFDFSKCLRLSFIDGIYEGISEFEALFDLTTEQITGWRGTIVLPFKNQNKCVSFTIKEVELNVLFQSLQNIFEENRGVQEYIEDFHKGQPRSVIVD